MELSRRELLLAPVAALAPASVEYGVWDPVHKFWVLRRDSDGVYRPRFGSLEMAQSICGYEMATTSVGRYCEVRPRPES